MPNFIEDNTMLQREYMLQEVTLFPKKKNYLFTQMFKEVSASSNIVTWPIIFNHGGLAKYISQGGEPHPVSGLSVGKAREEVSYKKESYSLDANEMRWRSMPGQEGVAESANQYIQDGKATLVDRLDARVEWECISAMRGSFTYTTVDGYQRTVNYGIPSSNLIDLTDGGGTNVWSSTSVDIVGMIQDWKKLIRGAVNPVLYLRPEANEYVLKNTSILSLLTPEQKQYTLQTGELGIKVAGVTLKLYDATYLAAHPTSNDGTQLPASETYFMNANEVFLIGESADSKPLYQRAIASCVEASPNGESLVASRFSYLEKLRKDKYEIVTGEYSMPIVKNPYSIVHVKISS